MNRFRTGDNWLRKLYILKYMCLLARNYYKFHFKYKIVGKNREKYSQTNEACLSY